MWSLSIPEDPGLSLFIDKFRKTFALCSYTLGRKTVSVADSAEWSLPSLKATGSDPVIVKFQFDF